MHAQIVVFDSRTSINMKCIYVYLHRNARNCVFRCLQPSCNMIFSNELRLKLMIFLFLTANSTKYAVFFERKRINNSLYDSYTVAFALYYRANIQYPTKLSSTLEFIQRYYAKIHPDEGTKSKKKTISKNKVLRFINRLHSK